MDELKKDTKGHTVLFEQKLVPLFQNKVFDNSEEAKRAGTGSVKVVQSKATGFCYNYNFDESKLVYDHNYNNDQTNSKFFNEHMLNVISILREKGIVDKKIVEIGCGKGDFLELLEKESDQCLGFDPAYIGEKKNIVKDLFSEKYPIEADLIILRHTLEHILNPHSFLKEISRANNNKGFIYIEVPSIEWIIKKNAFWDIFYEHCNYFSTSALQCMFNKAETGYVFGGQYIYCYADLAQLRDIIPQQQIHELNASGFKANYENWKYKVESQENGIVWGAGAKGSTFLNSVDSKGKYIKYVADINPVKQGKFLGFTAHPIVSPQQLANKKFEAVFIMNENYFIEISETLKKFNIQVNQVHIL